MDFTCKTKALQPTKERESMNKRERDGSGSHALARDNHCLQSLVPVGVFFNSCRKSQSTILVSSPDQIQSFLLFSKHKEDVPLLLECTNKRECLL